MSDRVRIPKDKECIINRLLKAENNKGVFNLKADIITFAAAIGYRKSECLPFTDSLEPIRQDVFIRHGYDTVINLIAIGHTKDPKILMNTDIADDKRIKIFEEYANGGLEILNRELKGVVNLLEHIILMIKNEVNTNGEDNEENVLSRFL